MALIIPGKITETGVEDNSTLTTCTSGGDEIRNSGIEFLRFQNDHASQTYTVTVTPNVTKFRHPRFGKLTKAAISQNVTAGNTVYFGPFKQNAWNNKNDTIAISYIAGTSGTTAISTISSGAHALKVQVLYLDPI